MMHADKYDSFKCVSDYNMLDQRNYFSVSTYLKYKASTSVYYLIRDFINVFLSFPLFFLLVLLFFPVLSLSVVDRKFSQFSLFKVHLFFHYLCYDH